jgi:hypothetical protein
VQILAYLRRYWIEACLLTCNGVLAFAGFIRVVPTLLRGAPEQIDFGAYYVAARVLNTQGLLYEPEAMRVAGEGIHYTGYIYPPFFAAVLRPLALFPYRAAELFWLMLNIMCLVGFIAIYRWLLRFTRREAVLLIGFGILVPAVYDTLLLGQVTLFLTILLLGNIAISIWRTDRWGEMWAGILLGIAISIKIYPIILGLAYIVHRRWTALIAMVGTGIIAAIVGILFGGGLPTTVFWLTSILPQVTQFSPFPSNQSLRGVVTRLFSLHQFSVPVLSKENTLQVSLYPIIDSPFLGTVIVIVGSIAILGISILYMFAQYQSRKTPELVQIHMAKMICVMLLITPVVWDFYLVHLLIPMIYVGNHANQNRVIRQGLLAVCLCLMLQRFWRPVLLYIQTPLLMGFGFLGIVIMWIIVLRIANSYVVVAGASSPPQDTR